MVKIVELKILSFLKYYITIYFYFIYIYIYDEFKIFL